MIQLSHWTIPSKKNVCVCTYIYIYGPALSIFFHEDVLKSNFGKYVCHTVKFETDLKHTLRVLLPLFTHFLVFGVQSLLILQTPLKEEKKKKDMRLQANTALIFHAQNLI